MFNKNTIYGNNMDIFPKYKKRDIINFRNSFLKENKDLSDKDKIFHYARHLWETLLFFKKDTMCTNPNKEIAKFIRDQKYTKYNVFNKEIKYYKPIEKSQPMNVLLETISLKYLTDPCDLMQDYFMGCAILNTFKNTWLCYSSETKRIFIIDENLYIYNITGGGYVVIKDKEFLVPFEYAYPPSIIPDFTYCLQHREYRMLSIFTTKLDRFYIDFINCFDKRFFNKL